MYEVPSQIVFLEVLYWKFAGITGTGSVVVNITGPGSIGGRDSNPGTSCSGAGAGCVPAGAGVDDVGGGAGVEDAHT